MRDTLLAASGHIDPAYAESMLGREQVANTYLGEGTMAATPFILVGALLNPTRLSVGLFLAAWAWKSLLDASNTRQFRPQLFGAQTPASTRTWPDSCAWRGCPSKC